MLTFYGASSNGPIAVSHDIAQLPEHVHWIDAFEPSDEETSFLGAAMGTQIPSLSDLVEIESSSRLTASGSALLISLPVPVRLEDGYPNVTPIGFIVTRSRVATLRFARLPSFETLAEDICAKGELATGGLGATVTILEMIVDHIADLLERIGDELDATSRRVFHNETLPGKTQRPRQSGAALGALLREIGRTAELVSKVSESLLGLSRIPPFIVARGAAMTTPELKTRLDTVGLDTKSLLEYRDHLADKAAFLLDALLGLTNIEQNNVFRVLTVVSVVGIPPTFVASMYGMNFKFMPELDWTYGYAYGLTVIVLSALIPALWFKAKGWF